ncbi:NADP-dependent (Lys9) (PDB:1E5L) [Commensalibacter communis]|nr:saccharopine dehydrogenase NADP-binding domain-containing protein [Commensalibacter communis]CAI3958839.1 NADP-dependent (Lys9) (PDB:1E5L) [Commensalibacter communis]
MMTKNIPSIGIVGATGFIGRELVANLFNYSRLNLAVRDKKKAEILFQDNINMIEITEVDITKKEDIVRFCENCHIIINCIGPSYRILDQIASVALEVGTHYIDPSGDETLYNLLVSHENQNTSAILAAGMLPGLSGLLPRDLAENFDEIDQIVGYSGGIDYFSPAGAEEFIVSLSNGFGRGGACIRAGGIKSSPYSPFVSRELSGVLPFDAYPFISNEFVHICKDLSIKHGDWFNIFFDKHVIDYISVIAMSNNKTELVPNEFVEGLIKANALDTVGRTPFQLLAIEIQGKRCGQSCIMSSIIHAGSGAKLSASVSASAALAICKDDIPIGTYYAANILSPQTTIKDIQQWIPDFKHITFNKSTVEEEGVL